MIIFGTGQETLAHCAFTSFNTGLGAPITSLGAGFMGFLTHAIRPSIDDGCEG